MYVILYLGAAILANLVITWFGPMAAIPTAFFFVGLDLTSRDHLHEAWRGEGLVGKMALLIATGSVLSWLINRDAGPIALASFLAFAFAATADAIMYHFLRNRIKFIKINGSNVVSAAIDSLVFPTVAFGSFLPAIVLGQFLAKVLGGFVWFVILNLSHSQEVEKAQA